MGRHPSERLRRRPYQGQVAEFSEVVHFRDPGSVDPSGGAHRNNAGTGRC